MGLNPDRSYWVRSAVATKSSASLSLRSEGMELYMHVTAIDVDPRAAHMAFVQFSLLHIPATVIVGNSLTLETREYWFTPAHILGG